MQLPKHGYVEAVAMIVDINRFESMVSKGWDDNVGLFVRDVLIGGVTIVEKNLGEVVAFMGDAFLAVLPDPSRAGNACLQIAKDLGKINEYVSLAQEESANAWSFATGGCGLKLALEIGIIEVNTITSRFPVSYTHLYSFCMRCTSRTPGILRTPVTMRSRCLRSAMSATKSTVA